MKREDLKAMKPGRELDALVAEHIYQWRRISGPKTDYDGPCEYGDVLVPPTVTSEDEAFRMMPPKGAIPFYYFVNRKWSTDISAAWEVVRKLREDNWWIVLNSEGEKWSALFYWDPHKQAYECEADEAPEAICKAALLVALDIPGEETE